MGDPRHVQFGSSSPEPESATLISPERARKVAALLFAARDLTDRLTPSQDELAGENLCSICQMHSLHGEPKHLPTCEVGRVEWIIAELCAAPSQPIPIRKEAAESDENLRVEAGTSPRVDLDEATADAQERMAVCLKFCEGISTETLQRELPLASADRRRWHEIMYLRQALPWLPAVTL
jgi:hypothetical protein